MMIIVQLVLTVIAVVKLVMVLVVIIVLAAKLIMDITMLPIIVLNAKMEPHLMDSGPVTTAPLTVQVVLMIPIIHVRNASQVTSCYLSTTPADMPVIY